MCFLSTILTTLLSVLPMALGLGIFCLVFVVAALAGAFWLRKKQIQMKTAWKIGHDDLIFLTDRAGNLGVSTNHY